MPQLDKYAYLSEYIGVIISLLILYIVIVWKKLPQVKKTIKTKILIKNQKLKEYSELKELNWTKKLWINSLI